MSLFNSTAPTETYTYLHTLSLHGALPISPLRSPFRLLTARCRHILFTQPAESSLRSNYDRIVHRPEELVLYTFELRRDLDLAAELLGALVMGETKRDRGFEQHAARRTNVDRFEVAAVLAI